MKWKWEIDKMYSKNKDKEKIAKSLITYRNTMNERKQNELNLFFNIPLKKLLIENIIFNLKCKCPTFISPFHMKYNNFNFLIKQRIINEIGFHQSDFLINLRKFYFGLEQNNCKYCGKETNFISISKGYKDFCNGYICCNNFISNQTTSNKELMIDVIKKRKETFFSKGKKKISESYKKGHLTRVNNGNEVKRLNNIRKTNENNGKWIKLKEIDCFELYKRLVETYTKKSYRKYKKIINPLNLPRTRFDKNNEGYHLDHIISKKYGFDNCILPYIIGSKQNLQMLSIKENSSKQDILTDTAKILLNDIVYS